MTGYERVSVLLNSVFLVPLLQPRVSSIPSVNVPVSRTAPGSGVTACSVVVLFVGRCCTGKILFFIPWLLAVWPAHCSVDTVFIVNQICEQGRLN